MADEFAVAISCGALGGRRQANAVEVIQIIRPNSPDFDHSRFLSLGACVVGP
jgi:hypothetical protein